MVVIAILIHATLIDVVVVVTAAATEAIAAVDVILSSTTYIKQLFRANEIFTLKLDGNREWMTC